jgi:pimeloyl-ACP methyl ester carboxylesterase
MSQRLLGPPVIVEVAMHTAQTFTKVRSDFASRGARCNGDLYLPVGIQRPPVIVMAHGFASKRIFRLPAYAEHFVQRGLAVFLFDYRGFGDSDGEPRHLVDPRRHVEDWRAAAAHVRLLPTVDGSKLALWGTSFSGGHVIVLAAEDPRVKAIVAQVPFVDPFALAHKPGIRYVLQVMGHGLWDLLKGLAGQSPHYVKVAGHPGEFAIMNTPEALPGYQSLLPNGASWQNRCPARILLSVLSYRPVAYADRVRCPALVMYGQKDSLTSAAAVEKMAARMANCVPVRLPFGHFEIYTGQGFEEAVDMQADFLTKHLQEKP